MADQSITISSEQQKALEEAIRKTVQPMGAMDAFCGTWPTVKPVLNELRNIIALVPGISVFAGPAIVVVIAAGDAAFAAICKKT